MGLGASLLMEWTQYMAVKASLWPLCFAKVPQTEEGIGNNLRLGLGKNKDDKIFATHVELSSDV